MPASITVAIIDDHKLLRKAITGLISTLRGYKMIFEATDGLNFFEQLATHPVPRVIFLDVQMKGMDGFETLKKVGAEFPQIKVIALSMSSDAHDQMRMKILGAHAYLHKSAEKEDFQTALETVIHDGIYFPLLEQSSGQAIAPEKIIKKLESLKSNELVFMKLACMDLSYQDIAVKMNLSRYTIDDYSKSLFKKFNVRSRMGLVQIAVKYKVISL